MKAELDEISYTKFFNGKPYLYRIILVCTGLWIYGLILSRGKRILFIVAQIIPIFFIINMINI